MDSAFRWYGFVYVDYAILNQWMIPDFSNATPTDTNHFIESAGQNIEYNLRPIFEKLTDVDFYVFSHHTVFYIGMNNRLIWKLY